MDYNFIAKAFKPFGEKYIAHITNPKNIGMYKNGNMDKDTGVFLLRVYKPRCTGYSISIRLPCHRDFVFITWQGLNNEVAIEVYTTNHHSTDADWETALSRVQNYIANIVR